MPSKFSRLLSILGPLFALIAVVVVFAVADSIFSESSTFLSIPSLQLVGAQNVKIGIAALGMTMIIILGGIDLSVGTAAALCGCLAAMVLDMGYGIGSAIVVAIAGGMLCGLMNGALISLLRLVPFIITLGAMTIFLGLGKFIATDGGTLRPPTGSIPEWLYTMVTIRPDPTWLAYPLLPNFSWGVWLMLGLSVVVAIVLHCTVFGRHIFAIGSNEATARLCGVPVQRTKILVYTIAGFFVGLAGLVDLAFIGEGDASAGMGVELKVIAAVVIGGGSLSGGRGSVLGTLCGVFTMGAINHGCTSLGLENQVEDILVGLIIVAAVYIDRLRNADSAEH